ncbi:MAG: hypothetical protein ACREKL_12715 [Chthoniobacterales bacterium]
MFCLPPLLGFLVGMMSGWSSSGGQAAFAIYAISMIVLGIAAAAAATSGLTRVVMAIVFLVGMVFLQCAVFFVGCTIIATNS